MIKDLLKKLLFKSVNLNQKGGNNGMFSNDPFNSGTLFFITIIFLIIKVLIVMICYNYIVPRLMISYNVDISKFRYLNFLESLILVILFNNLFCNF